jgi:hypothetical protein
MAASATFDLKAGEWFRRGRLLMIRSFLSWQHHATFCRAYPLIPLFSCLGPPLTSDKSRFVALSL